MANRIAGIFYPAVRDHEKKNGERLRRKPALGGGITSTELPRSLPWK
jgi:hypothetical protein